MAVRSNLIAWTISTTLSLALTACAHDPAPAPETAPVGSMDQDPPAPPEPESGAAVPAETKEVTYSSGTTTLKGFIAYPASSEKRPAVIVVHEWWGHNDYARDRAKQLAQLGYVGFAIDMYGEGKQATHPEDANKFMMEALGSMPEAEKRFDAAKALLMSDPRVDGSKLAGIGYCFGGAVLLHMARVGTDLDLIGSFHGNLATKKPMPAGVYGGKIFIAHGGADPFVPQAQLDAFKKEMDAAKANYEVEVYAGAKHAFTNPAATDAGTKFNLPLAYDSQADAKSWEKLRVLLAQTFQE